MRIRHHIWFFLAFFSYGCEETLPEGTAEITSSSTRTGEKIDEITFSSASEFVVVEGQLEVGSITVENSEDNVTTFTLSEGADASLFSMTETGQLSFLEAPDYEDPKDEDRSNVYSLTVIATQEKVSGSQNISVSVSDSDDSVGGFITKRLIAVRENEEIVRTIKVEKPSDPIELRFSLKEEGDWEAFRLGTKSGTLIFKSPQDFENPSDADEDGIYNIKIRVSDGNKEIIGDFDVKLVNVVEIPTNDPSGFSLGPDKDFDLDQVQLKVDVSKAADESDLTGYALYWGDNAGEKLSDEAIVVLDKSGENLTYQIPENTDPPESAESILVGSKFYDDEKEEGLYATFSDSEDPKDGLAHWFELESNTFEEDFANGIDNLRWKTPITTSERVVEVVGGALRLTYSGSNMWEGADLNSEQYLVGDFDLELDFNVLQENAPTVNWSGGRVEVRTFDGAIDADDWFYCGPVVEAGGNKRFTVRFKPFVDRIVDSGRLKISRVGSEVSCYLKEGNDWTLLSETVTSFRTVPVAIKLRWANGGADEATNVSGEWDNIVVRLGSEYLDSQGNAYGQGEHKAGYEVNFNANTIASNEYAGAASSAVTVNDGKIRSTNTSIDNVGLYNSFDSVSQYFEPGEHFITRVDLNLGTTGVTSLDARVFGDTNVNTNIGLSKIATLTQGSNYVYASMNRGLNLNTSVLQRMRVYADEGVAVSSYFEVDNFYIYGAGSIPSEGVFGNGQSFDGVNDRITFYNVANPGSNSVSISAFFKLDGFEDNSIIVSKGNGAVSAEGYKIILSKATTDVLCVRANASNDSSEKASACIPAAGLTDSKWHHVVMVINRDTDKIVGYLDGSKDNWTAGGHGPTSDSIAGWGAIEPASEFSVGDLRSGVPIDPFWGQIDEVRIYNRVLTEAEIGVLNTMKPID